MTPAREIFRRLLAVAAVLLAAGCANTRVEQQWSNPDYAGRKLTGKVMVVGVTRDPAFRRQYEDQLCAYLAQRGVAAYASHLFVAGRFNDMSEGALVEAARREGMGTLLSSFVVDHERVRLVVADAPAGALAGQYEGWYRHYWPYLAQAPEKSRVIDRYIAETIAFDIPDRSLRWSARTRTDASGDPLADIDRFAAAIARALAGGGLI